MAEIKSAVSSRAPEYVPGLSVVRVGTKDDTDAVHYILRASGCDYFLLVHEPGVYSAEPATVRRVTITYLTSQFGEQTAQMADRLTVR